LSLEFKEKLEGQQTVNLWARDRDGVESGWQALGKWAVPASPELILTPKEGRGAARYFFLETLSALDPKGTAGMSFLINDRLAWEGGCGFSVDLERNRVALADGKGGFLPEVNSYSLSGQKSEKCEILSGGAASYSDIGAYVYSTLRFAAGFAGQKKIWANARDRKGRESGWHELGVFEALSENRAPAIELLSAAAGADGVTRLRVRWSDPDGLEDLQTIRMKVGTAGANHNSCLITTQGTGGILFLYDDRGFQTNYAVPGNDQRIQNSQCSLNAALSDSGRKGDWMEATLALTFTADYAGARGIYLTALDYAGAGLNEKSVGQISVPIAVGNTPPRLAELTHEGRGLTGAITAYFEDDQGGTNLSEMRLRLTRAGGGSGQCELRYRRLEDDLSLLDEAGQEWLPAGRPGQSAAVRDNGWCTVDARQSSVKVEGRRIRWTAVVTVKADAAGWQVISAYGKDAGGAETGWTEAGAWDAVDIPEVVQISPASGGGPAKNFYVYARTGQGNADMAKVSLLVNGTPDAAGGCVLEGDYTTKRFRLANDEGTGWTDLDQRLAVKAENSQCQILAASFSTTTTQVMLVARVLFKESFNGPKALYGQAENRQGLGSGWVKKGTWSVAAPNHAPELEVFEAEGGRGSRARVKLQVNDWNGLTDLFALQLRFGNLRSSVNSCVFYLHPLNGIGLVNDAGTSYSIMLPGSSSVAENSQCRLAMAGVKWNKDETRLEVELPVEFLPAYAGMQEILLTLQDEVYSGFSNRKMGEWVVE
jgi:hypothetical protein